MTRICFDKYSGRRAGAAAVYLAAALVTAAVPQGRACAQGKLDADYSITFARLSVGSMTLSITYDSDDYSIAATIRAGGIMRALANGEASMTTRGTVKGDLPLPTSFSSKIVSGTASEEVRMLLEDGNVKELVVTPPESELTPATDAERQGIIDPLTALLVPTSASEPLAAQACQRTFRIFDGRHRHDLSLAFRRLDKASAQKGYAGPVVVCALTYRPIAGKRDLTPLEKYLSEGGEMEIALAALAGIALLAPVYFSATGTLASLIISATRFETAAQPPR
jgi:hypothetical protein